MLVLVTLLVNDFASIKRNNVICTKHHACECDLLYPELIMIIKYNFDNFVWIRRARKVNMSRRIV